jgi:AbrB family looped-hinge helix DNA binding protein
MKNEIFVRVDKRGRVVIPASFRKKLGMKDGDPILFRVEDGELVVTTVKRHLKRARQRPQTVSGQRGHTS